MHNLVIVKIFQASDQTLTNLELHGLSFLRMWVMIKFKPISESFAAELHLKRNGFNCFLSFGLINACNPKRLQIVVIFGQTVKNGFDLAGIKVICGHLQNFNEVFVIKIDCKSAFSHDVLFGGVGFCGEYKFDCSGFWWGG